MRLKPISKAKEKQQIMAAHFNQLFLIVANAMYEIIPKKTMLEKLWPLGKLYPCTLDITGTNGRCLCNKPFKRNITAVLVIDIAAIFNEYQRCFLINKKMITSSILAGNKK